MFSATYQKHNVQVQELRLPVPLDHFTPTAGSGNGYNSGRQIEIFARILTAAGGEQRPWLLFLQGGPGCPAPREVSWETGWVGEALRHFRLVMLDQRGTGASTGLDRANLGPENFASAAELADFLAFFRADQIVADAEALRRALDVPRWSLLGQSYGGFLATHYWSAYPESLVASYHTGGLPGLTGIEQIYRHTFAATARRNQYYFAQFPDDEQMLRTLAAHLADHEEVLPTGERLSPERLRMVGISLGSDTGTEGLHYLFEDPFTTVGGQKRLSARWLEQVGARVSMGTTPLYAVMHETIYASATPAVAGQATNWAAARLAEQIDGFSPSADPRNSAEPFYLYGEHIQPWLFDQDPALAPLAPAAQRLAQRTDWPVLYQVEKLSQTDCRGAAAVYYDDIFVPRELSLDTAATLGIKPWITNEYQHDGLRWGGAKVLGKLLQMDHVA